MSKTKLQSDKKKNISPQKDLQDNTLRIMENLLSSCRLCLSSFGNGQSIIDLFEADSAERPYSGIAMDLTSLTVRETLNNCVKKKSIDLDVRHTYQNINLAYANSMSRKII